MQTCNATNVVWSSINCIQSPVALYNNILNNLWIENMTNWQYLLQMRPIEKSTQKVRKIWRCYSFASCLPFWQHPKALCDLDTLHQMCKPMAKEWTDRSCGGYCRISISQQRWIWENPLWPGFLSRVKKYFLLMFDTSRTEPRRTV